MIKLAGVVCACNPRNGKLRQDLEFKDNLDCIVRLSHRRAGRKEREDGRGEGGSNWQRK